MQTNLPRGYAGALLCVAVVACSKPKQEEHHGQPSSPPTLAIGYGTVMADVARRFELIGRAVVGERFEFAEYELGELEEQFTDTIPHATPPREGHPEVLPAMAAAFVQATVADLRRGIAARDRAQGIAAFERAAAACNACHQASGHGFIEVPNIAGRSVPNLEPVAPAQQSRR